MLQALVQHICRRKLGKHISPSLLWSESEESRAKGLRPLGSLVSGLVIGLD